MSFLLVVLVLLLALELVLITGAPNNFCDLGVIYIQVFIFKMLSFYVFDMNINTNLINE